MGTPSTSAGNTPSPLFAAKPGDYTYGHCTVGDLKLEQGFCGERFNAGKGPLQQAPVAPGHEQSLQPAGYLSITWFGKVHYISPALYAKDAEKYHELHWKDAWLLWDSIKSNEAIYDEWANPSGFFEFGTAKIVYGVESLKELAEKWFKDVERAPKPDIAEFRKLTDRTFTIIERLAKELNDGKLEADKVAQDGIDLELVRGDLKLLIHAVTKFRDNAIDSAEHIKAGLETVESTSFQILNIVPTLTGMDPFREAAYKIGVLLLRASARGVGGYTAWGTMDAALREGFAIIRSEAPGVIVDVVLLPLNRLCRAVGMSAIGRHFCTIAVQQIIEFACAYYKLIEENKGKDLTAEQLQDLFYDRCASLIGALVGLLLPTNLVSNTKEVIIKGVATAVLSTIAQDYFNAKKAARDQNREIIEVMMADLPGTIMRVVQASIVGIIQRRAQQTGQQIEQQRATRGEDGTTGAETAKILVETNVSDWARTGNVSKQTLKEVQQGRVRNPVPVFTWREYRTLWQDTNLDYATAQQARRFADNNNVCVIAMDPAQTRSLHTDSPEARGATGPKPMGVKAKSSNNEQAPIEIRGLVVKPIDGDQPGGPTHKDYKGALKKWQEEEKGLFKGGFLVKPNGVVFHPDQLERWAQLHPEDKAACQAAAAALREAAAKGYHDLTKMPPPDLSSQLVEKLQNAEALLAKAKVGYYSDLDLVEVVDFANGKRRFMGDLGEKKEVVQLARDNREHMNDSMNIHDYDDPELPPHVQQLARQGDAVQHGGNNETVTLTASKKVDSIIVPLDALHMVFPGGDIVHLNEQTMKGRGYRYEGLSKEAKSKRLDQDIRTEIERELQMRLKDNYQPFANRAEGVRKAYEKNSPRFKVKGKAPPPVSPQQLATVQKMFNGIEIMDEPGLGQPISSTDIWNSLTSRHLSVKDGDVERALRERGVKGSAPFDARAVRNKFDTMIGVDFDRQQQDVIGENLVIAVSHYRQSLAQAIASLLRTRQAMGSLPSNVKVWYEIYTAYRPVASAYVRDRLGGPDPGVSPVFKDLAKAVSSFGSPKDEKFHAFCVTGFVDVFSPGAPKLKKDPSIPPGYKRVEFPGKGHAIIPDDSPKPQRTEAHDPRPIQGLMLTDVWEHTAKHELDYRPTKTGEDTCIAVMPESIRTGADPRYRAQELAKMKAQARNETRD